MRCQEERSNIAFTRIAGNEKHCRPPSLCVENSTTRPCKNVVRPGRLTARASTTSSRRSSSQTSKPFERTFERCTVKFCKMRCVGWTRLSRPFFFAASVDKYRGFPAFVSETRYDSFTYPQAGFKLSGSLSLSKIGDIKIKLHRAIEGQIKTLSLKRENGMWYACFSCIVEPEPLPANDKAVGLDVGLLSFVTRSDGPGIGNPRLFKKAQKRLRRAQRRVARREKFSKRWKKAVRLVAKIHRKVSTNATIFSTSCLERSSTATG